MQERFPIDGFAHSLIFSDEATFHLSGKVNRQNTRNWGGRKSPRSHRGCARLSESEVFCAISNEKVYGPFFFEEATVNGMIYSHTLENWLMSELNEDSND